MKNEKWRICVSAGGEGGGGVVQVILRSPSLFQRPAVRISSRRCDIEPQRTETLFGLIDRSLQSGGKPEGLLPGAPEKGEDSLPVPASVRKQPLVA